MSARCRNAACRKIRRPRPGQGGLEGACDYCGACFFRWHRAGRPESGPPAPRLPGDGFAAARRALSEARESRLEDFAWLRSRGVPVAVAARRAGVAMSTAYGYEADIRAQAARRTPRHDHREEVAA